MNQSNPDIELPAMPLPPELPADVTHQAHTDPDPAGCTHPVCVATQRGAGSIEALRAESALHGRLADGYRGQARYHGVRVIQLSRQLADLPCDATRTHGELMIHLGWHHGYTASFRWTLEQLQAEHQRIIEKAAK